MANKEYFGSFGMGDPEVFNPGIVAVRRKVNFKASPLIEEGDFMPLPKRFIATGYLIREVKACTAGVDITVKAGDTTIGSLTTAGAGTAEAGSLATAVVLNEGAMVTITPTPNKKVEEGVMDVTILGYLPDFDSLDNLELEVPYRRTLQTTPNVSGGDPYLKKVSLGIEKD